MAKRMKTFEQFTAEQASVPASPTEPWRITSLATRDELIDGWDQDTTYPGIGLFSNAIQVWAVAQNRSVTANEAALAFNVRPELIIQAVEWHGWMFVGEDGLIEHEGE